KQKRQTSMLWFALNQACCFVHAGFFINYEKSAGTDTNCLPDCIREPRITICLAGFAKRYTNCLN
ncbi:MAG: hypothetical protein ABF624_10300, partial [Liquorilactobacillus ghanensis]|uniref:hypothetical protein n=1 Tax=Liquorilactobacillus ghanensis TaxID=399370 RepID=UPI0039E8EA23